MARSFSKKGLRRDLNFSDMPNPKAALNNLLNDLIGAPGEVFTSDDLEPIINIKSSNVKNQDFKNIIGLAPTYVDTNGGPLVYDKPVIKIKNRIDAIAYTSGVPLLFGGNGLTAKYFPVNQIDSEAVSTNDIFIGSPTETTVFWERGNFNFSIFYPLGSVFGGVSFTGFFKPTATGSWSIPFETTSFFTVEFDNGSGGYDLFARKSQVEYDFSVDAVSSGTILTLQSTDDAKNILIGDRVINATIAQFNDPENPVFVTSVNRLLGTVTLSETLASAVSIGTVFTFEFQIGFDGGSTTFSLGELETYKGYAIRIRYWFPEEDYITSDMFRTMNVNIVGPGVSNSNLDYRYLYSEDYPLNPVPGTLEYGEFKNFFDNKLSFAGGIVGGGGSYSEYQSIETTGKLIINYKPPISYASIKKSVKTITHAANTKSLPLAITDSIEVGNYAFSDGITASSRVTDISVNSSIFISINTLSAQTASTVTFIDHRGLGAFDMSATWTSGGNTISNLSTLTTANIFVGDIVLSTGSPAYNRVLTVSSTSVTVSKNFTASSGSDVDGTAFFYRADGLYNNSLVTYCENVYASNTTSPSSAGSNIITVEENTDLAIGQVVQFGSKIPDGTTITDITDIGADYEIELSNNITDIITSGQLIIFASAGTTESKEICYPPTDTSAPFNSTLEGLETPSIAPSLTLLFVAGTSELKFVGLSAEGATVEIANLTDTYNREISITDGSGSVYKLLGFTT
jgi:hypothetical protein